MNLVTNQRKKTSFGFMYQLPKRYLFTENFQHRAWKKQPKKSIKKVI